MKTFKNIILILLQRPWLQGSYEKVLRILLLALNYGGGTDLASSGETGAVDYAAKAFNAIRKKQVVLFDVGANNGEFALMAEKVFDSYGLSAHVFAFEPSLSTYKVLSTNLKNRNSVQLINKALGSEKGQLNLYSVEGESGLTSVYNRNLEFVNKAPFLSQQVDVDTLDNFCSTQGITHIDYLKLDVEGHEFEVLKGASEMFNKKSITCLQFEFGGANIDSRTYFKDFFYLLNSNYRIYKIVRGGLHPVNEYKEFYEIFITTNYLAVLREDPAFTNAHNG